MSADNFNIVIQGADGKWYVGTNFSMSKWLDRAQATGYWAAWQQAKSQVGEAFETAEQAAATVEGHDAEYGTSMIEYEDWFGEHSDLG